MKSKTPPATAEPIPDRRLALMFACAHPAIEHGMRAPLILQTILGLTAEDIAAAFLIPPATMGQRLVRAKTRIKDAGIPFAVPETEELAERLEAVLDAIYAAYTKGWSDIGELDIPRDGRAKPSGSAACSSSLLPEEPEAKGMLALMLYAEARRAARRDAAGAYVPLEEQDTSPVGRVADPHRRSAAARRQQCRPDRPLPARGGDSIRPHRSTRDGTADLAVHRRIV